MLNKININFSYKIRVWAVYIVLTVAVLAIYLQVNQFDFINVDDDFYVTSNSYVQSGITLNGFRWAFSIKNIGWDPLTFISLMLDYQLYGSNAGGYHLTNLILHILSTLLLFALFNYTIKNLWTSAFIAALFALHPLQVETVAFIAARKDVLSVFFWMLTLYLYVHFTKRPTVKSYLLVLLSFVLSLMSKPIVVTLPVIMILLDYWPLGRFKSKKDNLILWQLREKSLFIILSVISSVITTYARFVWISPSGSDVHLSLRVANALVSFVAYLKKIFWPYDLAAFYVFSDHPSVWHFWCAILLILIISAFVVATAKRFPYFLVGWSWYAITLMPVIGIILPFGFSARVMADRYAYLPSIGIYIMLACGMPLLFGSKGLSRKILFSSGLVVIIILSVLTWRQCGYWKSSMELVNHTLRVTKSNYLAYIIRGKAYYLLGQYQNAIADCNEAIRLKPDFVPAYYSRGVAYDYLGQYQRAVADYSEAIRLKPDFVPAYKNRGLDYGKYLHQYQDAIGDFNEIIKLQPNYARAYQNRGFVYLIQGDKELGCHDAQKACTLGECELWKEVKGKGYCL